MATQRFAIRTEPHVAEIGKELRLEFVPEGDVEFLDAYAELTDQQKEKGKDGSLSVADAREQIPNVRRFLAKVALPESAEKLLDFEGTRIPLHVLTDVVTWLTKIYTGSDLGDGAKGARPTTRR